MRAMSLALLILSLTLSTASRVGAQQPTIKTYTFDHYLQKTGGTSITELATDEEFSVVLYHTCPQDFDYSIYKSPNVKQPPPAGGQPAPLAGVPVPPHNPSKTVTKGPITHEAKWGSYVLEVTRTSAPAQKCSVWVDDKGTPVEPPPGALDDVLFHTGGHWVIDHEFAPANYIVSVQTSDWEVGADAALAYTAGVDKKFAAVPASATDTTHKIVGQDTDGEGAGRISIGSLTHLYIPKLKLPTGPVVGFSIVSGQNNQTEYYFGWGLGIGPRRGRLNLALGGAYSPTPTLPVGIHEGDPITDVSTIATLRNVYRWKFFFALTATAFKSGDDSSGKPAAPSLGEKK
jgi:hypothetical protein